MSIESVQIDVLGHRVVSSEDWQRALNTPSAELPPLANGQSAASKALGLPEEEDRRRIFAQSLAYKRIEREGRLLLKRLAQAFHEVPDFHPLYLLRDMTKGVWVITADAAWVPPVELSDEDVARILQSDGPAAIEAVRGKLNESVKSSRQPA
jgi:hypothetical protein